jgi:hypothetical protein
MDDEMCTTRMVLVITPFSTRRVVLDFSYTTIIQR